jgi:outer membrane protein
MRRILLSLAFLPIIINAQAQDATPLSLQQCIDYALKHNYTVKNAALDVLIQKAQINEQVSGAYPHVNAKAEFDDFVAPQYQFIDASAFNPNAHGIQAISFTLPYAASGSITASQVLFDGSVLVALQARKSAIDLAKLSGEVTKSAVRYNVTKAYYSLTVAQRQLDIIKISLRVMHSYEHDIKETYKSGMAEKIDVERTTVQVNNLATDSLRLSNFLSVSEHMLKYQLGMDINASIILTDTNLEQYKMTVLSLLDVQKDYNRIPSFNLLLMQQKLNEYNVRRYKLTALPSLSVFANAGSNYAHTDFNEIAKFKNYYSNFLFGVQLNMPLFNGLLRVNQLKEAKLNVEKTQNNIEYQKQSIDFVLEQSRANLRNNLSQVESQKRNLELSNDVLDLAQKKYNAGVGSNMEVTTAQADLLKTQNNYFGALLDVINSATDLQNALGLFK